MSRQTAVKVVSGHPIPARLPMWSVAPLVALIALGLVAGFRRPMPMLAMSTLAGQSVLQPLQQAPNRDPARPAPRLIASHLLARCRRRGLAAPIRRAETG